MLGKCIFLLLVLNAACTSIFTIDEQTQYDEFEFDNFLGYKFENNCTMSGIMCKNCEELVLCQEIDEEGIFNEISMKNCSESKMTCFPNKLECSSDYNEMCDLGVDTFKFKCKQAGIFPDPYNCIKYHICNSSTSTPTTISCSKNFGFDPFTLRCSFNTSVTPCKPPVNPCKDISQGGIERNQQMYYVCNKDDDGHIHPSMYYCPNNQKFIGNLCANPSIPEKIVDGKCKEKGLFYVQNCTQYNNCNAANEAPKLTTCGSGTFFSTYFRACIANRCL